ncbi:hypothetical protein HanIR_Chr02g0074421 [Helianthus annuus]|nr:hypothetical protein HanIR_Chr02g0074421 [Helianthus annuus]
MCGIAQRNFCRVTSSIGEVGLKGIAKKGHLGSRLIEKERGEIWGKVDISDISDDLVDDINKLRGDFLGPL